MSGFEAVPALSYVGAALGINSLYGSVTGEEGGLIGEALGVTDDREAAAARAKAETSARQQAALDVQAAQVASLKESITAAAPRTDLPSVTPPPAEITLAAPPVVAKPEPMPVASQVLQKSKRESLAAQRRRQGRASTILTQNLSADTLG